MSTVAQLLRESGIDIIDARILLSHALGFSRTQLITRADDELDEASTQRAGDLLSRRRAGEPVAYLIGEREFHGLRFAVSPGVLIPRPDTELLVQLASERITQPGMQVLDLGTGSGAIAVTLGHLHPDAQLTATDASAEALEVATRNAELNQASVRFLQGDWYQPVDEEKFDMIVSNPPYIAAGDPHLAEGDLRFEPVNALTDHADGLSALRSIISGAHRHLRPGAWLLLEHGYDQAEQVRALLSNAGLIDSQSWCDLAGIERVSGARLPS